MNITRIFALAALVGTTASMAVAAPSKSSVPSELVGKWRWSSLSTLNYENSTTGAMDGGGGMSMDLKFTKDGRYTSNLYIKVRTYSLVTESNTHSEGTVTWRDGQFTLHPVKGHQLGFYAGKKKVDRPMTAAERKKNTQWYWKWDNKDGKRVLMMGPSPNTLSPYKREK